MPYNLFITSIAGDTRKALRSPYPTREAVKRTVWTCIAGVAAATEDPDRFIGQVLAAPLGETVRHEATGVAFRTEEA